MEQGEVIVAYNFSSSQTPRGDSGVYIDDRCIRPKNRVVSIRLLSAQIPHTWPLAHPSFQNTRFIVEVTNGGPIAQSVLDLNPTGGNSVYEINALAARAQTVLTTAMPLAGWTVTVIDGRQLGFAVGAGWSFRFVYSAPAIPLFDAIRGAQLLGLYDAITPVDQPGPFVNAYLSGVLDLQPVRYIYIIWKGTSVTAEADGDDTAYGTFVVPVSSNFGEFTTFNPSSQFENQTFMRDRVFDITDVDIRVTGPFGRPIPFNGGAISMLVEMKSNHLRSKKRLYMDEDVY